MSIVNITKNKNRIIISISATILSSFILFAAIHAVIQAAVIICTAVITYSLLSLIHQIAVNRSKNADISRDEGCESEQDMEILSEEDKTQEGSGKVMKENLGYTEDYMAFMKAVPARINGFYQDIDMVSSEISPVSIERQDNTQYGEDCKSLMKKTLHPHMDAFNEPIPSSQINVYNMQDIFNTHDKLMKELQGIRR